MVGIRMMHIQAALALACAGVAFAQTPEHLAAIEAAAPAEPYVKPAAPRKLLVFTLCKGFPHPSIPYGAAAIEAIGRKTGAYETTVSDDPAVFAPDSLGRFDAVVMDNTTGTLFDDPALKQSLLDFVKGGRGFVGIHAANDSFYDWPEYGEMIGAYFDGHPWGAGDTVTLRIEEPAHPVCEAFLGQPFRVKEEIYQFKAPYSRENLRVLISLDPATTDMTKQGMKREDGDYAVAWVRSYGAGRVFYTSLGHNEVLFADPTVLKHYLAGIQFALGDLPAETVPSAQRDPARVAAETEMFTEYARDKMLATLATCDYGQNPNLLDNLASMIDTATPELAGLLADKLAALLEGEATPNARQFASDQLSRIGTDRHVPALAKLLSDPETAPLGCYALQRIPAPAANEALIAAVASVPGAQKVGIVNALGARRDASSVAALSPLLADADPAVAGAAAKALGRIGGPGAVAALEGALDTAPAATRPRVAESLLAAVASGHDEHAVAILQRLYAPAEPKNVRLAALEGLIGVLGEKAGPFLVEVLMGDDADLRAVALQAAGEVPGSTATQELAANLPELAPEVQATLLIALAARADRTALPAVVQAADHADAAVREAALAALATLGDVSVVPLLVQGAAERPQEEARVARESLNRVPGLDVDPKLVEMLAGEAPAAVKVELAKALAERRAQNAVPTLLGVAVDADEAVRGAAYAALAILAAPQDTAPLVNLLVAAPEGQSTQAAEDALVAVAARGEAGTRVADVLGALNAAQGAKAAALIRVLGRVGDDGALDALRAASNAPDPALREAAVRALAGWPTPAPVKDLENIARDCGDETLRAVAIRAFYAQLGMPSDRPADETLALLEEGLKLAKTPEEVKLAISGLGGVPHPRVKDVLEPFLKDPAYEAEARAALAAMRNIGITAISMVNGADARLVLDGDPRTRWTTGGPQKGGTYVALDLGHERPITKITLDATGSPNDYPGPFAVLVSQDQFNWVGPVAKGAGKAGEPITTITFEPVTFRHVVVVLLEDSKDRPWSIHEIVVE